jgi:hypothetical protein
MREATFTATLEESVAGIDGRLFRPMTIIVAFKCLVGPAPHAINRSRSILVFAFSLTMLVAMHRNMRMSYNYC